MSNDIEIILETARNELGVKEDNNINHNVKYNEEYYGGKTYNKPELHWCAVFIWWVFNHSGLGNLYFGGKKTAHCQTLYDWNRINLGNHITDFNSLQPGDIVFFNWENGTKLQHVGIVSSRNGDYIYTYEGNTAIKNNRSCVAYQQRHRKYFRCAYRPKYKEEIKELMCHDMKDVPDWAKESVQWGIDNEYIKVVDSKFNIYESNLQAITWIHRMMKGETK